MSVHVLLLSIIISTGCLCGIGLLVVSLRTLKRKQRATYFLERHQTFLVLLLSVSAIPLTLCCPLCIALAMIHDSFSKSPQSLRLSLTLFELLWFYGLGCCQIARYWLWWFEYSYTECTASSYSFGEVQLQSLSRNWFVQHLATFGDKVWLLKRCLLAWLTVFVIHAALFAFIDIEFSRWIQIGFGLLASICCTLLGFRHRALIDSYGIRAELVTVFYHFQLYLLWLIAAQVAAMYIGSAYIGEFLESSRMMATLYINTIMLYCPILGAKHFAKTCGVEQSMSRWIHANANRDTKHSSESTNSSTGPYSDPFNWRKCMAFLEIYMDYMRFLKIEFASESLEFATEFVQLKNYLCNNILFSTAFIEYGCIFSAKLPLTHQLPLMPIVAQLKGSLACILEQEISEVFGIHDTFSAESMPVFERCFERIYAQYLMDGAERELNMSAKLRRLVFVAYGGAFDKDLDDAKTFMKHVFEIMAALESVVVEMDTSFLRESFVRFRKKQFTDMAITRQTSVSIIANQMLQPHRARNESINSNGDEIEISFNRSKRASVSIGF